MNEFLSVMPEIYKGLFTGVVGAIISGSAVYLNEKSKRKALLKDNKRLVEETEKIKADYNMQLEELKEITSWIYQNESIATKAKKPLM